MAGLEEHHALLRLDERRAAAEREQPRRVERREDLRVWVWR